jgi:cob(I)alamin adenosyltransferase
MARKISITTRSGDDGSTSLFSGERVPKDHARTSAYGDVDELTSVLGVARAAAERKEVRDALRDVQESLFLVGAELATTPEHLDRLAERVDEAMVKELDRRREALESAIDMPSGFIIPGGTLAAAHIDHARTLARRCERHVVTLQREGAVDNPHLGVWLNRLSDTLWLLARREEGEATEVK